MRLSFGWKLILALCLTGGGLFAIATQISGCMSTAIGSVGLLMVVAGLKLVQFQIKADTPPDEDDRDPFLPPPVPQPVTEPDPDYPIITRRIRWTTGLLALTGFVMVLLEKRLHIQPFIPIPILFIVAASVFLIIVWTFTDKSDESRPIGYQWGTHQPFRYVIFTLALVGLLGAWLIIPYANTPIQQASGALPGLALMVGSWVAVGYYLHRKLGKPNTSKVNWAPGERRLSTISSIVLVLMFFSMLFGYRYFYENLVEELKFTLIAAGVSILPGYLLMDYFRNQYTNLFQYRTESRTQLLAQLLVTGMLISMFLLGWINRETALRHTFEATVRVVAYDEKKINLQVDYDGHTIGLRPAESAWKSARGADSLVLTVGNGLLGAAYIIDLRPVGAPAR